MNKKFDPLRPVPCVYFKHGAYWLVKRNKWTRIGTTLEEALTEYGRRSETPKGGMVDLIDRAHPVIARSVATSTAKQYEQVGALLKRKLVEFAPQQVRPKHINQIRLSMADTPNMFNRALTYLRLVFNQALNWEEVDANPCVGVKRYVENKRKRYITDAEWLAIYEAAGERLRLIMRLQLLTGQRINDVLKIRRSQLTEAGVEFKQQKTGAKLVVKWSPDLRAAVDEALALHRGVPSLNLFLGRKGKPPDYRSVLLQWHTACAEAKVEDAKPNDQRAKSATDAQRQGKNATQLLGHTTEAMTGRYLRDRQTPEVEGPSIGAAMGKKALNS